MRSFTGTIFSSVGRLSLREETLSRDTKAKLYHKEKCTAEEKETIGCNNTDLYGEIISRYGEE